MQKRADIVSGAKTVFNTLMGTHMPSWVPKAFGVAAAAPVIGHYIQSSREEEEERNKQLTAIMRHRGLLPPEPMVPPTDTDARGGVGNPYAAKLKALHDRRGDIQMGRTDLQAAGMYPSPLLPTPYDMKMAAVNLSGYGPLTVEKPNLDRLKDLVQRLKAMPISEVEKAAEHPTLKPDLESAKPENFKKKFAWKFKMRPTQATGIATG